MKTVDISKTLIGKKVECVFTGLKTTGVVIAIHENKYAKGVRIKLDKPIQWGDELYDEFISTARKHDNFGNLNNTHIICE